MYELMGGKKTLKDGFPVMVDRGQGMFLGLLWSQIAATSVLCSSEITYKDSADVVSAITISEGMNFKVKRANTGRLLYLEVHYNSYKYHSVSYAQGY